MQIEEVKVTEAQHAQETQGPQFTQLKLKKPTQKPKQELKTVSLPKVQLKSRIRYNKEWPPAELKPVITFMGSVRQNGELSRNIKEAAKLKKKPLKIKAIPDLDKVELEKPEEFDFTTEKPLAVSEILSDDEETNIDHTDFGKQEPDKPLQQLPEKVEAKETKPKKVLRESVVEKHSETITEDYVDDHESETTRPVEVEMPHEDISKTDIESKTAEQKELTDDEQPVVEKTKKKKSKETVKFDEPHDSNLKTEQTVPDEHVTQPDDVLVTETTDEPIGKKPKTKKKEKLITPTVKDELPKEEPKPVQPKEISEIPEEKHVPEKKPKTKKKEKLITPTVKDELRKEEPEPVEPKEEQEIPEEIEASIETQPAIPTKAETEVLLTDKKAKKTKKPKQKDSPQEPAEEIPAKADLVQIDNSVEKPTKMKLTPIKIERKEAEISKPQHAESIEGPQFTKLKLKKATQAKPKQDTPLVTLPKFQLKSRIRYVRDWPPVVIKPAVTFLGSVRQNGILSRNVKEAEKIKKKVYKQPKLPEIEKTELEKPMFGYEDIVATNQRDVSEKDEPKDVEISEVKVDEPMDEKEDEPSEEKEDEPTDVEKSDVKEDKPTDVETSEVKEDEPEQFTIKPKRPSIKKTTEEIEDEVTIKKKLKAVRKPSVTLPEITEPETVTFRPKSTKTKEDVEQEFNIQLDSYAEEEISMSSKVKLKPLRRPTFSEEANETSIKFYEDNEEAPDVIEIIESDEEKSEETANVMMPLKKTKGLKEVSKEEISSSITVSKPKETEKESEVSQDISIKLQRKPKYTVDDQEEVSFDVKPQVEQYTQEELSLSSKIKLKPKKKITLSEAADETSIQLKQEVEDDSQAEEIILSDGETDENIEMIIKRKPKKPAYEVSEVEELSVELKPKRINEDAFEEEQITVSTKRKPRKPSKLQGIE